MRFTARPIAPLVAALVVAVPTAAHADYIWATIVGGQVRFALTEDANATPNPQFASYVEGLTPRCDGKTLSLVPPKEGASSASLPAGLSPDKSVVTAEKTVGVRERGGEMYLLVYHAKGAASLPAAGTQAKAPAEVLARRDGENLVVSVRLEGKSVPQSEVWVQWPGAEEATSVKTDDKGDVKVPWPSKEAQRGGFVSIRAKVNDPKAGELDGKKYNLTRRWATLTFPIEGPKPEKTTLQILTPSSTTTLASAANPVFLSSSFSALVTR